MTISEPLCRHLKALSGLWSASLIVTGCNFVSIVLIVSDSTPDVYAAYTVALAIMTISAAWSDGGLATTLNILAAQSGKQREVLEINKRAGIKYSLKIVPISYLLVLAIVWFLFTFSNILNGVGFILLALFGAAGVIQSRNSFSNALLYSCGRFRQVNISQTVPPLVRLIFLGSVIIVWGKLDLECLLLLTMVPGLFGWLLSNHFLKITIEAMPYSGHVSSLSATNSDVKKFITPLLISTVLGSLTSNITLLGSSIYANGVALSVYGIFYRINQIFVVFIGPLNQYTSRNLRLTQTRADMRRKGWQFIIGGLLVYILFSILAFAAYFILGKCLSHYSFNYPVEFGLFLASALLGNLYSMLDAILISMLLPDFRVVGLLINCVTNISLLVVLHPNNLITMILIDTIGITLIVVYYLYLFITDNVTKPVTTSI